MEYLFKITCKQAAGLFWKQKWGKLNVSDKIRLFLHQKRCPACINYKKVLVSIDKTLLAEPETVQFKLAGQNTEALRQRILKELQ